MEKLTTINEIPAAFIAAGEPANEIVGCTSAEIDEIEKASGVQLPEAYKEFLQLMGKRAGCFFEGLYFFYPEVLNMRPDGRAILKEYGSTFKLSRSSFVFLFDQSPQFSFFDTSEGSDPPVRHFIERHESGQAPAHPVGEYHRWETSPSYSAFLIKAANAYLGIETSEDG